MKNQSRFQQILGLTSLPMLCLAVSWPVLAQQKEDALIGEPKVIVEDLSAVEKVLLPTHILKGDPGVPVQADEPSENYRFVLDFTKGLIHEEGTTPGEPVKSICVGSRIEKIRSILASNKICDFTEVERVRAPGMACLTVIYPEYLIIPLNETESIGLGEKVDSCALPQRDLCRLSDAAELRQEVNELTLDFIDQIEEGSSLDKCL